ncbi:MAG: GNAT family N-acetyltransferase [Gammaproteobacteria bacterium]|jgi:ribosomal-protein-alanine N-acetyltransferase|nr:GNAT family N-acetyltransferase [Gammaproteobacteria bacterium]
MTLPDEPVIRPARPSDLPGMLEVLRHVNMHHIPSPEMPALDLSCFFVAEDAGGRIVGLGGYKVLSPTQGKTTLLAVHPDCKGTGLGYALQARRMEALVALGIEELTTNADRPEIIAWYKKHFGYREAGTLPKVHEFGLPDVDHWTTLRTDLRQWARRRKGEAAHGC